MLLLKLLRRLQKQLQLKLIKLQLLQQLPQPKLVLNQQLKHQPILRRLQATLQVKLDKLLVLKSLFLL
jgi:hypothetical protein